MINREDERDGRLGQPRSIALNGGRLSSLETSPAADRLAATVTRHGIETREARRGNAVREETSQMLILVALEPRLYGEVLGGAIRERRPNFEVQLVEPDALDPEVVRLAPRLVLCNRCRPNASLDGLVWIEYCPYTAPKATIYTGDQRLKLDVDDLADLLSVVDKAEDLA